MIDQLQGSARDNKARQQAFVRTLQHDGELERVGEFVEPGCIDHSLPPGLPTGAEGVAAVSA